jgi:hypothetical protein
MESLEYILKLYWHTLSQNGKLNNVIYNFYNNE